MLTSVTGINWGDEGKGRVIDPNINYYVYNSF